ncbi:hypothetical protein [Streptomyces sp. NPDC057509]|uniref:hypothetical protein n=1 Tax=Streptomyces sp. NPDC057509 TaxID=3346152 RepID=UPI0036829307
MSAVRSLVTGPAPVVPAGPRRMSDYPQHAPVDVYALSEDLLDGTVKGLTITGNIDQIHLERKGALLEEFVRRGGRVLVNGHVVRPFLPGLTPWRALDHRGPKDLRITPVTPHPVFEGIDHTELLFRTGVPGTPTGEELARVGVAGFYGRGYYSHLPEGATVINGIGPQALPIDVVHPLGDGQVMLHGGNDLISFADPDRSTRFLGKRLHAWLEGTL